MAVNQYLYQQLKYRGKVLNLQLHYVAAGKNFDCTMVDTLHSQTKYSEKVKFESGVLDFFERNLIIDELAKTRYWTPIFNNFTRTLHDFNYHHITNDMVVIGWRNNFFYVRLHKTDPTVLTDRLIKLFVKEGIEVPITDYQMVVQKLHIDYPSLKFEFRPGLNMPTDGIPNHAHTLAVTDSKNTVHYYNTEGQGDETIYLEMKSFIRLKSIT